MSKNARHRLGLIGEYVAIWLYRLKFYSIIGHRVRNKFGELDFICIRGKHIVFVEVKARSIENFDQVFCTTTQRQRIVRAASIFLSHNPQYKHLDIRFDLVIVSRYFMPKVIENYTI